nr:MAG TPA: hypothetical protein [Caudoviricetes sp.]
MSTAFLVLNIPVSVRIPLDVLVTFALRIMPFSFAYRYIR